MSLTRCSSSELALFPSPQSHTPTHLNSDPHQLSSMSSRTSQSPDWPQDLWTNIFKAWTGFSPLNLATIVGVYYIIAIIYDPHSCTTTTRSGQVFRCAAWIAPFVRLHNVSPRSPSDSIEHSANKTTGGKVDCQVLPSHPKDVHNSDEGDWA